MGVPALFAWLSRRHPTIIRPCDEEKARRINNIEIAVDACGPNPGGVEHDCLYLDMNGIIHPCCHPEEGPEPQTEEEMFARIFAYIDRLFNIVRPRHLVYLAVDGVAPRAKMNQQRSRRFRGAKESREKRTALRLRRAHLEELGVELPAPKAGNGFDPNCITPGTRFMADLAARLHAYCQDRLATHPAWKSLRVILSDGSVPGEGEHKIMDFLRAQSAVPGWADKRHVLYGADADLILLGMATHLPHICVIREQFRRPTSRPCELCNGLGHSFEQCTGKKTAEAWSVPYSPPTFLFIDLAELAAKVTAEMNPTDSERLQPERARRLLDDWIFLCTFVGNDFLPNLPSLSIHEGALEKLVIFYKEVAHRFGGHLNDAGTLHWRRIGIVLEEVGRAEALVFQKRYAKATSKRKRRQATKKHVAKKRSRKHVLTLTQSFKQANQALPYKDQALPQDKPENGATEPSGAALEDSPDEGEAEPGATNGVAGDTDVRLWESGFKERYYLKKMHCDARDQEVVGGMTAAYLEGLSWVMRYYYRGCASWEWYFPYHYAPFASDFHGIDGFVVEFPATTRPFRPLEQLMGVFPADSSKHLPPSWASAMTDTTHPLCPFYPADFAVDLNGHRYAWQGVTLLPFVDERLLLASLAPVYKDLTAKESARNQFGHDTLMLRAEELGAQDDRVAIGTEWSAAPANAGLAGSLQNVRAGAVCCARYLPSPEVPLWARPEEAPTGPGTGRGGEAARPGLTEAQPPAHPAATAPQRQPARPRRRHAQTRRVRQRDAWLWEDFFKQQRLRQARPQRLHPSVHFLPSL